MSVLVLIDFFSASWSSVLHSGGRIAPRPNRNGQIRLFDGQRRFARNLLGFETLDGSSFFVDPYDGAGGAALDRSLCRFAVSGVIDNREIVDDLDQAGGASAAQRPQAVQATSHSASAEIAIQQIHACDPQPMTDRMQREQILGTDGDAIAAGRAFRFVDYRQPVRIHIDSVESADAHAIG